MPLPGAPHDLYAQLLTCSSSERLFEIIRDYLLFCCFSAVFLPTLPSSLSQG